MNKRFTNDFKLKVYQSELLKQERYISSSFYYHARGTAIPKHVIPYELALDLHEYYAKLFSLDYQCANLINRAMRKKSRRIKLWALKQLSVFNELYFVTINFNDEIYEQNSLSELKAIVQKYFNSLNCNYCYCLGVGDKTNRMHYHALTTRKPKTKKVAFGSIYYKKVADTKEMNKDLLLEYLRYNKFDLEQEKLIFDSVGQFLPQTANYIARNSYHASLVLNKEQRISFKENIKISEP